MSSSLLRRLMARQLGRWLLVACLWTPVYGSRLLVGLLFQAVFDTLAGRAPLHLGVPALIALVACVDLARVGLQFEGIIVRLEPELEYRARDLLRTNVLRAILRRPGARAVDVPLGEAVSRLGADVDELGRFMIWSPTNVSRAFLAALALVIMLRIDAVVTLGVAVPLAAVAALSRMANARVTTYRRASRQTAGEVSAALGEILAAVQAIKVAGAEERVVGHLRRLGQARRRSAIGEQLFTSLNLAVWSGAAAVGTGIILLLAASSLRAGRFSVGDLALFVTYLQFLADSVALFAMLLVRLRRADVAMDRVAALVPGSEQALVERPPAEPSSDAPHVRLSVLEARGLTYRHTPGGPGIAGVDLSLRRGTVTVVTGRIGAGKTTLLRTLLGLLRMEAGTVRWNGRLVSDPATFLVPPRCAYVPQAPKLFSASIRENVLLGLDADGGEPETAVKRAVLQPDLALMEDGLETVVGPRGVRLSGGQVQRVAAARAFVRRPDLLVFDDLSSALDVDSASCGGASSASRLSPSSPSRTGRRRCAGPTR